MGQRGAGRGAGDTGKDRQFVTALSRGLEVLRAFRPGEVVLGNQEIAERTGLPKPTVSRLTHTLCELGYLTSSRRAGGYQLGPGVLALGFAMIAGLDVRERARPLMEDLAEYSGASVALGARDRMSVVYLDLCRGAETVTLRLTLGSRVPLMTTAIGRAIVTALPEEEQERLLHAARAREPDDFPRIEAGIVRARREIAERGFCTSFGDWRRDVHAVGVPLRSIDGEQLYGLNCGGPSFTLPPERLTDDLGPRLVRVAEALSARPPCKTD